MNTSIDTPANTTPVTACCYEGCDARATDYDHDGDLACGLHAAQSERYDVVTDLDEGTWCDREIAERVEKLLAADGWTVSIRAARGGEAEGTYRRGSHGLQILGCSIPVPEELTSAVTDAWNRATQEPAHRSAYSVTVVICDSTAEAVARDASEWQDQERDLDECVAYARANDVAITLSDAAGFSRGRVEADGSYTLR